MPCGAKTRVGGKCRQPAMPNGRCRMHGGKSLSGIASGTFKTGRWSKDLPTRLASRYEAALADTKLLELRNELAVIDSRLGELLGGLDTGEAGAIWKELRGARKDLGHSDEAKRKAALGRILSLIDRGAAEWMGWEDVFRTIERRARIAESERRRLVEAQQMMSSEQAMTLLGVVVATIQRHVTDPGALRGISADLARILSHDVASPQN